LVLPFWYWPTQVVPDKGPLNGCVCVCVYLWRTYYTEHKTGARLSSLVTLTKWCHFTCRLYRVGQKSGATNSWPLFCQIAYCKFTNESFSKKVRKSVKIWQNYSHEFVASLFCFFFLIQVFIKNLTTPCIWCHTTMWNIYVRKQAITY